MFRDEKLEMKVGLFIGIGLFLMFFIVFSISDFAFFEKGYRVKALFDFVNGIKEDAPVRLAGVHIGEVETIDIFYDQEAGRTRIRLNVWVKEQIRIETDSVARINTLGLLGEQYLEITPGSAESFLEGGDEITGKNPVNVGEQMERMMSFVSYASNIAGKIDEGEGTLGRLVNDDALYTGLSDVFGKISGGEGTLGKLIADDTLYNDLETVFGRLSRGEGTLGKFLVDDTVYDNVEEFTTDIKQNPWKLLRRDTAKSKSSSRDWSKGSIIQPD